MNERIRQFARESHIDVYGLGKDRESWEAVQEKFAELIVKECARLADNSPQYIDGREILEHFGVEE